MLKKTIQMSEKKEMTKGQLRRVARKDALLKLLAYIKEATDDKEILEYVTILTPGQRFGRTRQTGIYDIIINIFSEQPEWAEDQIWSTYKLGRAEMRKIRTNLIKKRKPDERLWISFDAEKGTYTLEGTGPDAPDGWTGYKPVTIEDMEIV